MLGVMVREAENPDFAAHSHGHNNYRPWLEPPTKVRTEFPETWIWTNVTVG